jgi:hypothetical protein
MIDFALSGLQGVPSQFRTGRTAYGYQTTWRRVPPQSVWKTLPDGAVSLMQVLEKCKKAREKLPDLSRN